MQWQKVSIIQLFVSNMFVVQLVYWSYLDSPVQNIEEHQNQVPIHMNELDSLSDEPDSTLADVLPLLPVTGPL